MHRSSPLLGLTLLGLTLAASTIACGGKTAANDDVDPSTKAACTVEPCVAPPPPPVTGCDDNGTHMEVGESVKAGCNWCTCDKSGDVYCTTKSCPDPKPEPPVLPRPRKACDVDERVEGFGKWIESGTEYKVDCNTCYCDDGVTHCTEMACATPPVSPEK